MNCLNTMGAGIHLMSSTLITYSGSGSYTQTLVNNTYIISFMGGDNTIIINADISTLNVIVSGKGAQGIGGRPGAGGGGGGFGLLVLSNTKGTSYSVYVNNTTTTGSSIFTNNITNDNVSASDGSGTTSGVCTKTVNMMGTLTKYTGGVGGGTALNSSGTITLYGIIYKFGGAGATGQSNTGMPGNNGIGGSGTANSQLQASATTTGSGGGGRGSNQNYSGYGGPGIVMLIFKLI
jgi:hypothetical protein